METPPESAPPAPAPAPEEISLETTQMVGAMGDTKSDKDQSGDKEKDKGDKDDKGDKGDDNPGKMITICHATGSESNPFVTVTANANGIISGHVGHQDGRDIIPPFEYKDGQQAKQFPGQNWDAAGQEILRNGCEPPPPPVVKPTLSVPEFDCFPKKSGLPSMVSVTVSEFSGLKNGVTLAIAGPNGSTSMQVTDGGVFDLPVDGVGEYTVTLSLGEKVIDSGGFVLEWCKKPPVVKPTLSVPVFECFPHEDPLPDWVTVTVSEFGISEPSEPTFALLGSEESEHGKWGVTLSITGPDGTYTVPVPSGGDYALPLAGVGIYTVTLAKGEHVIDSGEFVIEQCAVPPVPPVPPTPPAPPAPPTPLTPAVVVTATVTSPAPTVAPALAVTGSGESEATGALAVAAFLTLAGAAALLGARRRHAG
ncbi:MAG: hypothetical protein WDA07_12010 [Leucobacter sp.]